MSAPTKPKGILYITIFYLAIAAILVVAAILCLTPSPVSGQTLFFDFWQNSIVTIPRIGDNIDEWFGELLLPNLTGWGVAALIVAALVAIIGIMLFQLKVMGRNLAMLIALPLIAVLLGLIVLWYLFKDDVKAAFSPPAEAPAKLKAKPR